MVRAAAACRDDFGGAEAEFLFEQFEHLPPCAGHAFENGAGGFGAACGERQAEKDAAGVGVPYGCPFSEQIGEEDESAAACGGVFRVRHGGIDGTLQQALAQPFDGCTGRAHGTCGGPHIRQDVTDVAEDRIAGRAVRADDDVVRAAAGGDLTSKEKKTLAKEQRKQYIADYKHQKKAKKAILKIQDKKTAKQMKKHHKKTDKKMKDRRKKSKPGFFKNFFK